jgi:hypothetical protein
MYKDINIEEKVEIEETKTEKNRGDVYCNALSWTFIPVDGRPPCPLYQIDHQQMILGAHFWLLGLIKL